MSADIAILTALPKELEAVKKHLLRGGYEVTSSEKTIRNYYTTETNTGVRVVATSGLGMGQLNSALLTKDLLTDFSPKTVILTGIAAGISDDVNLGDVVISDQIVDYEIAKIEDGHTLPRWSVYRSDARLVQRILNLEYPHWKDNILVPRPDHDGAVKPQLHVGVIMSGNKVINDSTAVAGLKHIWRRATALEMEAVGIAAALHQAPESPEFIMIKGICDKADGSKNDTWQDYAADVAAAFTASFVGVGVKSADFNAVTPKIEKRIANQGDLLFFALTKLFDLEELQVLAFKLKIDWDDLPGNVKSLKAISIIKYMEKRGRLKELLSMLEQERPLLIQTYREQ